MTNEQQPNQPLTRRQLRELRSTGATPILTPEGTLVMPPAPTGPSVDESAPAPVRAADAPVSDLPVADAPDTRDAPAEDSPDGEHSETGALAVRGVRERTGDTDPVATGEGISPAFVPVAPEEHPISLAAEGLASADATERGVVSPQLGAALLAGTSTQTDDRPSFDQLLSRPSGVSTGTGSALIMTDSPPQGITAPVNATGEVLVTGSLALPDLFATTGQMPGQAEGLDIDATFADGELPQHSSPTPIAASAAVSTVKTTAEIIKPPVPEKGSRLMLTLAITAGALALALVGVLIVAFATGVFS